MSDAVLKAIAAAVVGGIIGWSANALTLTGRVSAIEATLSRIEQRLDAQATKHQVKP